MKIKYITGEERENIIAEKAALGLKVIEEHNISEIIDGESIPVNYLVFATEEEISIRDKEAAGIQIKERDKSGKDMRIIEDLIDILLLKGLISEADIPPGAMDKLNERKRLRETLKG